MIHMILHAIFGLIIGLLARAILPGWQQMGLNLTMSSVWSARGWAVSSAG